MTEPDSARKPDQGGDSPDLDPRAELLNVLIRGLETARRKSAHDIGAEEPVELFCTYAYAEAGTLFCPLFYMHS
ncbi:hypothetical protein [Amycolatopsis viridis]|uniref:Uncharacterized protein n=1 Tax=Amycolatopsis viridis TaxID=185678 RepID=A0ABX0ST15_9PSEU|nr:hypothetical protein [Amycolatopsis viridis]NIH79693.1 hypothetical protein [Amycolatopsis viridis]